MLHEFCFAVFVSYSYIDKLFFIKFNPKNLSNPKNSDDHNNDTTNLKKNLKVPKHKPNKQILLSFIESTIEMLIKPIKNQRIEKSLQYTLKIIQKN